MLFAMLQMNKNEILKTIENKEYYVELPSQMDMSIKDLTLYIKMDAEGVLQ